jgi:hypothetical protein
MVVFVALGCSDESAPRSSVVIESINGNQVLDSDIYNNGDDGQIGTDDDFIVEDQVSVVLRNRPHDPGINVDPDGPFGAVTFHRYEIRFTGDESLDPHFGGMHLRVPTGTSSQGEIVVVPVVYKITAPLVNLLTQGGEIRLVANITLIGKEDDSNSEVIVEGSLPVHVANWGDD